MLESVVGQKCEKLLFGGLDLSANAVSPMAYKDFRKMCTSQETEFFQSGAETNEQIEDLFWINSCTSEKKYAINNPMSLFEKDVLLWNLDQFTKDQSNIHSTQTHHSLNVCIILHGSIYLTFFINK